MSNARKKLVDIIRDQPDETVKLADAIIAALPGLVKPLEWYDYGTSNRPISRGSVVEENGSFYRVNCVRGDLWEIVGSTTSQHPTLEAAKAAAQAHYTAQIMAAFGVKVTT